MTNSLMEWQPIETAPRGSGDEGPRDVRHPDYVQPPKVLLWKQEGEMVGYYVYAHDGACYEIRKPGDTVPTRRYIVRFEDAREAPAAVAGCEDRAADKI